MSAEWSFEGADLDVGESRLAAEFVKKNETTGPQEEKANLGFGAHSSCSVSDVVLEKSKEDDTDYSFGVSSEFGACLDDSESREFVRDPVIHEQAEDLGGILEDPLANNAMQFGMEEESSCMSKSQVGPLLDAQVGQ